MTKDENGEFRDFTTPGKAKTKEYKNKVIWLHKSQAGNHLYAFGNEGVFHNAKLIIMNITEVEALIEGDVNSIKISIMQDEENAETETESG